MSSDDQMGRVIARYESLLAQLGEIARDTRLSKSERLDLIGKFTANTPMNRINATRHLGTDDNG